MTNSKVDYYENPEFWVKDFLSDPAEVERIAATINRIPMDVGSFLDVGCGNGAFLNLIVRQFPNRFRPIVGVDRSAEALVHVETGKCLGDIRDLPFGDASFDLVSCSEVLEHLSVEEFKKGIIELDRVSRKYIVITVPNHENLEYLLVRCPNCCCWFNQEYHVRSFNQDKLATLFQQAKPLIIEAIGPMITALSYRFLGHLYFVYGKRPDPAVYAVCPQCGYTKSPHIDSFVIERRVNKSHGSIMKVLARPLRRAFVQRVQRKRWLLALYEKS